MRILVVIPVLAAALAACGDGPSTDTADAGVPNDPDAAAPGAVDAAGAPTTDAASPGVDASPGQADAAPSGTPDSAPAPDQAPVPSSPPALFAYLQARTYDDFAAESAVHPSSGPHSDVRTFINDVLEESLTANNPTHPVGSAAVKELHDAGGLDGWAVAVKIAEGAGASTWYWYEVFSTTDGSSPIEGVGLSGCVGCHGAGADYIRVRFPLE